jgi:uncharacterized protein (TIGR02147 family)
LLKAFTLKKESYPAYSMRALARDLDLSLSYVSGLLDGKKKIPVSRLPTITKILEMDAAMVAELKNAIRHETLKGKNLDVEIFAGPRTRPEPAIAKYVEVSSRYLKIVESWHYLALLDLTTCTDFQAEPSWSAKRLGISEGLVKKAFSELQELGLIEWVDQTWRKTELKIRFPVSKSLPQIRNYHKKMMEKAVDVMMKNTDPENYSRRLITSVSFAANLENLEEAKALITNALYEAMELLSSGPCSEVFQLNCQLFPLSLLEKSTQKKS